MIQGLVLFCRAHDVPAIVNLSHVSYTRYILPSEHLICPIEDENRDINGVILKSFFAPDPNHVKGRFNIEKYTRLTVVRFN